MRRSDLLGLALAGCLAGAAAADAPGRVVSMNLCTDQFALMLAAPGQLVSVTNVALDPLSSVMIDAARGLPVNAGRAEEIYALDPDLVLANEWSDPVAVAMLRDLGIAVAQFPVVTRLDEIAPLVRDMGRALGREAEAEAMASDFEAGLAGVPALAGDPPVAAFFYANGYSLGAGTLGHDIITRAGFANLAERLGRGGGAQLSLEELIMNRPDVIVTSALYPGASRSEAVTSHPALSDIPRIETGPDWVCGTPHVLDAVRRMRAARLALDQGSATVSQ